MKLLVVDDEESLREILKFNLEVEGYDVDTAGSAEEALKLRIEEYSLILLDVMMDGMGGFKMAKVLKQNPSTANIPIIFCTAKDTENDTVTGLNIGADDYIKKPFSVREVVARVKSVLRRSAAAASSPIAAPAAANTDTLSFEGIEVDLLKKTCFVEGDEVLLTRKELEILIFFLQNRGRIFSREEILNKVWTDEVVVLDRTIDVNITRLRKKIGKYGEYIKTRLGYGYGFEV